MEILIQARDDDITWQGNSFIFKKLNGLKGFLFYFCIAVEVIVIAKDGVRRHLQVLEVSI